MIVEGEMKCLLGYVDVDECVNLGTMVFMKTRVLMMML